MEKQDIQRFYLFTYDNMPILTVSFFKKSNHLQGDINM